MQNHYSMVYREEEREMFPTLKLFGVGSIPWSPLARGLLTRPLSAQTKRSETDWIINDYGKKQSTKKIINRHGRRETGKREGNQHGTGINAPIVGTTSLEILYDLLGGVHVTLTEDEIKQLDTYHRGSPGIFESVNIKGIVCENISIGYN
ncbi:NADP-dependent oxidoreductase domain-containing protein [Crucibulum laeve]|uniref:NADP-dependent oxidoreductase domain-containing protein n=1 Tax=Crucibulum laeve TaxID=68775 RepID=A0A5C3LZV4_9AGAR|nr:NADP-dependent oxidoreductase domain-containing protein [Crucibulum laeve]